MSAPDPEGTGAQLAMRSDRLSLLESRGLDLDDALKNEARHAEAAKAASAASGAAQFASGVGRHGKSLPDDQ